MVKFNPLLLMSRLISINLQPADQTDSSMLLLLLQPLLPPLRERERETLPPNFYDTESLLNGLEDSSHLALCGNKRKLVGAQEKWLLPVKSPSGLEIRKL